MAGPSDNGRRLASLETLRKYVHYVFDAEAFRPAFGQAGISSQALESARSIRGSGRSPAIILHGIMPRAGTVYVGELLRLHPDLVAYPYNLWEAPFLQLAQDISALEKKFLFIYRHNVGKLGENDFLPIFGASFIAHLYSEVPTEKRMLLKVPSVQRLDRFFDLFPHENLLVLTRDGRDLVESTLKTWPQLRFSFVCRRWKRSARMILESHQHYAARPQGYWLARFEDAVSDPMAFVQEACRRFGLDEGRYPFDQVGTISVRGSSTVKKGAQVHWDPVARPQGFDPTRRWETWSPSKRRTFKRIAGQELMDLGYCEDPGW